LSWAKRKLAEHKVWCKSKISSTDMSTSKSVMLVSTLHNVFQVFGYALHQLQSNRKFFDCLMNDFF
jgi:hypothetical protein